MDAMTMDTLTTSAIPQAKPILLCPKMESCVCDYLSAVFGGIVHCADGTVITARCSALSPLEISAEVFVFVSFGNVFLLTPTPIVA